MLKLISLIKLNKVLYECILLNIDLFFSNALLQIFYVNSCKYSFVKEYKIIF